MRKVKTNVILYFKKLGVRLVNNYADTDITTQTLLKTFEGFSQILKEQSGKKGTWVCLQKPFKPIAIILKYEDVHI